MWTSIYMETYLRCIVKSEIGTNKKPFYLHILAAQGIFLAVCPGLYNEVTQQIQGTSSMFVFNSEAVLQWPSSHYD